MSLTPDLQTQINALTARVAALDGQGLANPNASFVAQTNSSITGVKRDLTQSVLTLEGLINAAVNSFNSLMAAISAKLGLPTPLPVNPSTVVPPSGS